MKRVLPYMSTIRRLRDALAAKVLLVPVRRRRRIRHEQMHMVVRPCRRLRRREARSASTAQRPERLEVKPIASHAPASWFSGRLQSLLKLSRGLSSRKIAFVRPCHLWHVKSRPPGASPGCQARRQASVVENRRQRRGPSRQRFQPAPTSPTRRAGRFPAARSRSPSPPPAPRTPSLRRSRCRTLPSATRRRTHVARAKYAHGLATKPGRRTRLQRRIRAASRSRLARSGPSPRMHQRDLAIGAM